MSIEKLCTQLIESESSQDTSDIFSNQPLVVRNMFRIGARMVPKSSSKYPLAQNILDALVCSEMEGMKIVSWNVNSINSGIFEEKGKTSKGKNIIRVPENGSALKQLLIDEDPDIICLQETQIQENFEKNYSIPGYYSYWNSSTAKKGYSGVVTFSKVKAKNVISRLEYLSDSDPLNLEGRIVITEFESFSLVNTYVPNTGRVSKDDEYLARRLRWDDAMYKLLDSNKNKKMIWCGDLNVARNMMDIHAGEMTKGKIKKAQESKLPPSKIKDLERRLKVAERETEKGGGAGYTLAERAGIEKILTLPYVDSYRKLYPEGFAFTYWPLTMPPFRKANNGWRIDYFIVPVGISNCIESIRVLRMLGVIGDSVPSDHGPLVIKFA